MILDSMKKSCILAYANDIVILRSNEEGIKIIKKELIFSALNLN